MDTKRYECEIEEMQNFELRQKARARRKEIDEVRQKFSETRMKYLQLASEKNEEKLRKLHDE